VSEMTIRGAIIVSNISTPPGSGDRDFISLELLCCNLEVK
jgi:hypothetical protein